MADNPSKIFLANLIGEYYGLPNGFIIDKATEILRVAKIEDGKHAENHPHYQHRVYITRRAVKHFVEERKAELSINHTPAEVLTKITFAAEQIPEIIINFDRYEYEPPKHFYTRHYLGEPSIRILCEKKDRHLEICSIHFVKKKKEKI